MRIDLRANDSTARLADPGTLLATTHEVGEGLRVRLRLTRPSDAARVGDFLRGLAPPTRHERFPSPGRIEELVRHFTFYDPRERLVVAATAPTDGETIVGLADVALLSTGLAELGVVVDDARQGRGVGRLITEAVATLAMRRGANHVRARLPSDGRRVLRLMERLGPTVRTVEEGAAVAYTRLPATSRLAA